MGERHDKAWMFALARTMQKTTNRPVSPEREVGEVSSPMLPPVPKKAPPKLDKKPRSHRPWLLEYVVIRVGVPLGIIAIGVGLMTTPMSFWLGMILFYVGLALLAFDIAFEEFFQRIPGKVQVIMGLLYVGAIILASFHWIFVPAPLEIWAESSAPVYGEGSDIEGISWEPQYSEMHFWIKNPSSSEYSNFEAEISTDEVIAGVRETNGESDCKIASTHQSLIIQGQEHTPDSKLIGQAGNPIRGQHAWVIPLDKNGKPIVPVSGGDWSYKIRCDAIPANSEIDFFVALEVVVDDPSRNMLFGPPTPASWITMRSNYDRRWTRKTEITKCSMQSICKTTG